MTRARQDGGTGPALSIVICTWNRHAMLRGAIASVERQAVDDRAFELIVVDNSSDRAAQAAFLDGLSVDCDCEYVIEEVAGASRARNVGTALARGEIVAFLDDDAVADADWAAALLARFRAEPAVGVMGGPIVPIWPAARPAWLPPWADGLYTVVDHGPVARDLGPGEWVASANMAFRKEALTAAGGFPEAIGRKGASLLSNEDLAALDAVVAAGHRAFYEPRMRVRHHVHRDRVAQDWLRRRMAWQIVSDILAHPDRIPWDAARDRAVVARMAERDGPSSGLAGLWAERADPAEVSGQLMAVAALIRLLLAGPA